jgi:hypothetical protein
MNPAFLKVSQEGMNILQHATKVQGQRLFHLLRQDEPLLPNFACESCMYKNLIHAGPWWYELLHKHKSGAPAVPHIPYIMLTRRSNLFVNGVYVQTLIAKEKGLWKEGVSKAAPVEKRGALPEWGLSKQPAAQLLSLPPVEDPNDEYCRICWQGVGLLLLTNPQGKTLPSCSLWSQAV